MAARILPLFNHGFYAPMTRTRLALPDLNGTTTSPFIAALRPICEIIFDLMLGGYVSSLEVYHNRSVRNSDKERKPRKNLHEWERAITFAQQAQGLFRDAETKRQELLLDEANATVQQAMETLKLRHSSSSPTRTASDY